MGLFLIGLHSYYQHVVLVQRVDNVRGLSVLLQGGQQSSDPGCHYCYYHLIILMIYDAFTLCLRFFFMCFLYFVVERIVARNFKVHLKNSKQ